MGGKKIAINIQTVQEQTSPINRGGMVEVPSRLQGAPAPPVKGR